MSSNNKTNQDNDLNTTVDNELHDLGVDLVDQNELEKSLMEKVKKKKEWNNNSYLTFIRLTKP